ncbi:GGDEF domain-containing protein [Halodesulfovibrio marinisediminis]|uniref:diguanylate cyclase n=1 Tax=Halodesulfovibrio marinisediminis DSM 17456 TaxID=1121457 RepID=A0A1N6FZH3_9BACT|nr:GGDEF domain-containing protein [Halodesulfovibrio marinisediminis]SIO00705.1 diguanylate cyclase (GGDEF) domain-containing protein [Halodesulfovibrio marinisediminis DSM 17456]
METKAICTEDLKDLIYHKSLKVGTYWILFSSCVLQVLNTYYVIKDYELITPVGVVCNTIHTSFLILGALCIRVAVKSKRASHPSWLIAALCIGFFWAVSTVNTAYFWNEPEPASRGVVIGAFSLVIGWYARPALLLAAFPTMLVSYLYLIIGYSDKTLLGLLLSVLKFPALIGASLYTLRLWLSFCTEKFVENEILTKKLEAMVRVDELTQIANRKGYNEALDRALEVARRFEKPLTLLLIDVDYFKQYNDHLGHHAGDRCIKGIAKIISKQARRAIDTAARIGGEEFALILPSCTLSDAETIADQMQDALAKQMIYHPASPISPNVTISIGIAEFLPQDDASSLYRKADRALYEAKHQGRNCVVIAQQHPVDGDLEPTAI